MTNYPITECRKAEHRGVLSDKTVVGYRRNPTTILGERLLSSSSKKELILWIQEAT
jgi:hypothetical protein